MSQSAPTPEELVERARALISKLRARAEKCEADRRVPTETIAEYQSAGLLEVCKPREYGGFEMGWQVLCEIAFELARGCGSSGWVYAVLAEHAATVASYPLRAQADVWGEDASTLVASGNSPGLKARSVEGGWRVSGQLNYSSGCDFADWHLTGVEIDGTPTKILLRQDECEVIDNWHVLGLAGTGSKDIRIDDVFVPEHRTAAWNLRGPRFADAAVFRAPQWSTYPFSLAAVSVGIAQGAIDHFLESGRDQTSRFGFKIAEKQALQLRLAESAAEVDACKKIILGDLNETMAYMEHAEELPLQMCARNKRDMAYVPVVAARAVDRIFYGIGAGGIFQSQEIQRSFRDVQATNKQSALNWDVNGTEFGKVALGLDPGPTRW